MNDAVDEGSPPAGWRGARGGPAVVGGGEEEAVLGHARVEVEVACEDEARGAGGDVEDAA